MFSFRNVFLLFCRMMTSLLLLIFAIDSLGAVSLFRAMGTHGLHDVEWAAITLLCALILYCALWLLVGIRSRVVAALGVSLSAGLTLWFQAVGIVPHYGVWGLLAATLSALPLVALGGGPFSLYRRGWTRLV